MKTLFSPWWLLLLAVAGAAALALVYVGTWSLPFHARAEQLGQLGDFFGGLLNPLVSLLTLFVAISVWQLQREELKLTRDELEQSRLAMEEQAKTAEQQRQEQRFFDLLNVLRRVEDSIIYFNREGNTNGKASIDSYCSDLGHEFRLTWRHGLGQIVGGQEVTLTSLKNLWHINFPSALAPYLRSIYRILAEAEELLGDQNYRYIKLLRAQLSDGELTVIGLAIWLDDDWDKLKHLVCKYGLLKHLSRPGLRQEFASALSIEIFGRTAQHKSKQIEVAPRLTTTEAAGNGI